ncbi:MAG: hypothetical protein ACHQHN_16675 [Sphingobacteriales bacterium]
MDRKIEHQPFSLVAFLSHQDWDIGQLCYKVIILLLMVFTIFVMFLYGMSVWSFCDQFHPERHQQTITSHP